MTRILIADDGEVAFEQFLQDLAREERLVGGEALDRSDEEPLRIRFQEKAPRTGFQGLAQYGCGLMHREDQDLRSGSAALIWRVASIPFTTCIA